jgi:hypothetical protein
MLLAYLLLFLLSASTGDATSRNPRIFLHPGAADVPVPSPATIHDHRRIIAKVHYCTRRAEFYFSTYYSALCQTYLFPRVNGQRAASACMQDLFFYDDAHDDPYAMMGSTPPLPSSPDMGTRSAATMAPSPSPSPSPQVDDNGGYSREPRGGGEVVVNGGGSEGGPPSSEATTAATEREERSAWDDVVVRVDYEGPRMDSPSHN